MSIEAKDPPPKNAQGQSAKSETEGTADGHVSADHKGSKSEPPVPEDQKGPTEQMGNGPGQSGGHENDVETQSFIRQIFARPELAFNAILSVATVMLVACTLGLVVATVGVYFATDKLATATVGLKTSTEHLVEYAKEAATDAKSALAILGQAANAARDLVIANKDMLDVWKAQLEITKSYTRDALVERRAHMAVFGIEVHNFDNRPGLFDAQKPLEIQVQMRNTGPTVANSVRAWARMIVAPIANSRFREDGTPIAVNDTFASQAAYTGIAHDPKKLSGSDADRVVDGKQVLFVYGEITYTDVVNFGRYTTKFRYLYKGDGKGSPDDGILRLGPAPHGNDAK